MRHRSGSTEPDGFLSGGRWFNFRRGPRVQPDVNNPTTTDGQASINDSKPQKVFQTFEQNLEAQQLCEASQQLIEREEGLFGEISEEDALRQHGEEVNKLSADYEALQVLVLHTLRLSFTPEDGVTEALTSAVNAINQQEEQDKWWRQRKQTSPSWRPCGWKRLHDSVLRSLVEERIGNPTTPSSSQVVQSSVQTEVNSMGRQLKEDLQLVVEEVKRCYPPEMDICNFYARLYHQAFSARLKKIANFGLDDKDCSFLLRWENEYYPEILQKSMLASEIDAAALGKLLSKELLEPLEEQYLSKQQDELTTLINRVLEDAKEKWNTGEEPTQEDGCFVSPVAYDIIQFINGTVTSAEKVVRDREKAQNITCQLKPLLQRFSSFQNTIVKQNKPNSRPFVKANLGCIEQFIDVLKNKSQLFPEDVKENCLHVLRDMKQSGHTYLLKPVHDLLKPQYRKLGTSDWLKKPLFEKLLDSLEEELKRLQGSSEKAHEKLISQLHQEVTTEYVKRLLKGQVKLKDKDQQVKAYTAVKDDAERLHDLFSKMGSTEDWLKEILIKIAEVLKLQDVPAIQMHVASMATSFPDLREKHVSALVKLKTNLSKEDRKTIKETLVDTLAETSNDGNRLFFSAVSVK